MAGVSEQLEFRIPLEQIASRSLVNVQRWFNVQLVHEIVKSWVKRNTVWV